MPIIENNVKIQVNLPKFDVNKKMPIFYNPIMQSHRNITITLLNAINKPLKISLPLAGSGIRALRILKEVKKIKQLSVNDKKENFKKTFEKNLKLNNLKNNLEIKNEDANIYLLSSEGFDYIDIDPFGSPNPFLASAISTISRDGILAITATDTAAFTGSYPKVTKRKYWSTTNKNYMMHELGLRILIRKVQLQGTQFGKALIPILSYHKDHYFRVYFKSIKSKTKCDEILQNHEYFLYCPTCLEFFISKYNNHNCCKKQMQFTGPLYIGKLFDKSLIKKMVKINHFKQEQKFLETLNNELDMPGFYNLHIISKKYKNNPIKLQEALKLLKATPTHFCSYGFKSKLNIKKIVNLITK